MSSCEAFSFPSLTTLSLSFPLPLCLLEPPLAIRDLGMAPRTVWTFWNFHLTEKDPPTRGTFQSWCIVRRTWNVARFGSGSMLRRWLRRPPPELLASFCAPLDEEDE